MTARDLSFLIVKGKDSINDLLDPSSSIILLTFANLKQLFVFGHLVMAFSAFWIMG